MRDKQLCFVVIEALNLWSNFCREYAISCLYKPKRIAKGYVTVGNAAVATPGAVVHLAAQISKGPIAPAPATKRDEPKWYDRVLLIKLCFQMKCSHAADVQIAMSGNTRVFEDLPTFRNFYAHRNDETAEKAVKLAHRYYVITGVDHPSSALAAFALKRPQPLILDWLDDMETVMGFLCD